MRQASRSIRCLCFFLCLMFCLLPFTVSAQELDTPSVEEANAVLLFHIETGETVVSKNVSQSVNAASTGKVIAGLLACEALGERMSDTVYITSEMVASSAGYRLYIKSGDTLTVEQLLYAAICGSYNDAFDVLAYYIAGSSEAFVEQMNRRAVELGAVNTVYSDPSGIDDSSRTSAEDLAKIAQAAYQNSLYMSISSTTRYAFSGSLKLDAKTIYNRNALIASGTTTKYYNAKCRGMNAGYTPNGGSCVATVATNGSESYLCIVLGALETDQDTYAYVVANRLIDWVYQAYAYKEIVTPDTVICTLPVTVSDLTEEVEVRTKDALSCFLPIDAKIGTDVTFSVRLLYSSLEAPVEEGMMVGYLAILYRGKTLDTLPLYTAGTAERSGFISSLKSIQALTQNRAFLAGAIFFSVALIGWIVIETLLIRRRHHKWDKYYSMKMDPAPNSLKNGGKKKRPPHV